MDLSPLLISLKVAVFSTFITFFAGLFAAYFVLRMKHGKGLMDGLFTLPLVLPPTVVGFFLLIIFGKNSIFGRLLSEFNISVVFSWTGAVIASCVVSFPLMYRTCRGAFEQIDVNLIYAAQTLGMSAFKIFYKIIIPNCVPSIIAATILTFSRALGEFGATIMLAGNIPGRTQTMSTAVYTAVQGGDRALAYKWVIIIVTISFISILLMNSWTSISKMQSKRG